MKIFFTILVLLASLQALASQAFESADMNVVDQKIRELGNKYGKQNVLVVYDLDNTLLAMKTDLGSDQWFDWQSGLMKTPENPDLVAHDFSGLLKVQGILYTIGSMRLTQPELPQIYEQLSVAGFRQILLTSRGPDFRDATEKELLNNSLKVWNTKASESMTYGMPYSLNQLDKSCLTEADKVNFKLSEPRAISYGHNIILSSGQHKGMILKTWLCQQSSKYKAIVFADDKQKNVDAMIAAFGNSSDIELVTYRYSREDERVQKFHAGDKTQAKQDWQDLSMTLQVIFSAVF